MYSLKGDMLLLNAMVKKKDSAAAREALQASRHHNLSFLPHKSAPVPSPVMTSLCFFIVLFSESASLFVTVCLPLTDLAVSGARHTRSPLKAATLEASRFFQSEPAVLSGHTFTGFPLFFQEFLFLEGFLCSFFSFLLSLLCLAFFSANETVFAIVEDVHFLLQDSPS